MSDARPPAGSRLGYEPSDCDTSAVTTTRTMLALNDIRRHIDGLPTTRHRYG